MPIYKNTLKITEATIQSVLIGWVMEEKHHQCVLPNSNQFFRWECDLISVTVAGLAHEYEIKLNRADYNRDATKRKHNWLGDGVYAPAYFWYVTHEFEIEPPEKAGWIRVWLDEEKCKWRLEVKKNAPRLNNWKIDTRMHVAIARLLSFRIMNHYRRSFMFARKDTSNE